MAVSFETDIKPYFTAMDQEHMNSTDWVAEPFDLWSATDVQKKYDDIAGVIQSGQMPPDSGSQGDGPWPQTKIDAFLATFADWKKGGFQP